ncbi:HD domain-containing protein [Mucilaginibacter sp. KACC 22773]|uniref:HD domain-containing protein n=1 Tax=Mucilaginibacter sp. KACC 22773 TaxID=3025671 RepID=UPI0023666970|nr:HD domain-containing protein [Mucilaginibacter sp. KACC 22773]WDF77332.1 HD domain-containing protein [Mucilaginibacter sp. KACC 22773]
MIINKAMLFKPVLEDIEFNETEAIVDPLYGSVQISSFEKRLINTPEFQRLRGIKQLGFVSLVYPAAEHSRFVHSIGVCYQAKKLIWQINENFKREKRYRSWRKSGKYGSTLPEIPLTDVEITTVEKIVISAAALLHDLPHSPFSHEIESPNSDPLYGILSHDKFDSNPVLFKYLFDTEHSTLANVIKIYNTKFWEILKADKKWFSIISKNFNDNFSITDDGFIKVTASSLISSENNHSMQKLPLLAVMIFELHLFEKPKHWINVENIFSNVDARSVITSWSDNSEQLLWKPIPGWFRPYRKDIVSNTICADLIDYVERDGKHTGIISSIDLKFLDRMTISRAIPQYDDQPVLKTKWEKIPAFCEHVVFDIYDHKRGFIRESVITEILSCLQARYQLTERVYHHRVVEGARAMLQEIARLLCSSNVLTIQDLHTCNSNYPNMPISDESFLEWVMDVDKRMEKHPNAKEAIIKAAKIAELLKNRRIYREAVIIDGIHGYETGSMTGSDSNCIALDNALLSNAQDVTQRRVIMMNAISDELKNTYIKDDALDFDNEPLATIGARIYGKKYKVPRVLVAKPFFNSDKEIQQLDVSPLFACQDPPHIKTQLDAMRVAYNSLWRVFLFIHPAFHWNRKDAESKIYFDMHSRIEKLFLDFTNNETLIKWRNSIDFSQLLPTLPIDYVEFIKISVIKSANTQEVDELVSDAELRDLLKEIFAKAPNDSNNIQPLKDKDFVLFKDLISKDKSLIQYISLPGKKEKLINEMSTPLLQTNKNGNIRSIVDGFKIVMATDSNGDIFSQKL